MSLKPWISFWRPTGQTVSNQIIQVCNNKGTLNPDPVEINTVFRAFYSHLYKSESTNDETQMSEFFARLDMAKIPADDRQILDTQLSEITEAIKLMHNENSLGHGGFMVEFYVKFSEELAPLLLEMFKHQQGSLPLTLTKASAGFIH